MSQTQDDYYFRLIVALILGAGAGFLAGRFLGNFFIWIIVGCSLGVALEVLTRVAAETKKIHPPESLHLPPPGVKPPLPPKPPRIV